MSAQTPVPEIPEQLLAHISVFELPTGVKIRRMTASDYDLDGWAVAMRPLGEFLYDDGTVGSRPRSRAYEDLGLTGGDDDLQGKPDAAWKQVAELQKHYSQQVIMTLEKAWEVVQAAGVAMRHARADETVTVRASGEHGVVTDPGTSHGQQGQYVRVRVDGGDQTHVYPLTDLTFDAD